MTLTAETVEYAVRCANPARLHSSIYTDYAHVCQRLGIVELYFRRCAPHTVVQRRRIVTDWQPVDGEQ